MLADEAGFAHFAREQRQERRAAARRFRVGRRRRGQPLEPHLPVVRELRPQPVGADERMRQPPRLAFELAECLRQPARQREVVKILEGAAVFLPQRVQRRVRFKCHGNSMARNSGQIKKRLGCRQGARLRNFLRMTC